MPSKSDVSKAAAAAPAAASATGAVLPFVVGGIALLLAFRYLPSVGDVVGAAGRAAAEGTGDFFKGVFTGAERTETDITTARVMGLPDEVYTLTPGTTLGDWVTYEPDAATRYVVEYDESGLPVVTVENPSPTLPPPRFYTFDEAPLAQRVGAAVADPFTDLYTDPFFGSQIGGPSIQDAVNTTTDWLRKIF